MTAIGSNLQDFWGGLLEGKDGVKPITAFDVQSHTNKVGCEIDDPALYALPINERLGRATTLFHTALEDALFDAGIQIDHLDKSWIGISVGTTMGEVVPYGRMEHERESMPAKGPHWIARQIAQNYGLKGPRLTLTNACAAGNFALARAVDEIRGGRANIMIVGGVDILSWAAFTGFSSIRAMAPDRSRPFDLNRKGLILGEGAGVLILESREHVEERGGHARAKMLGYGLTSDAYHITQPDPSARGAIAAIKQALLMGDIDKKQVGYVSAHGTGTLANDRMEANALFHIWGEDIVTSSIKANIGHTLGAASAIEAVVCVKALETGMLPHTLNLVEKDPACNVDVIAFEPRKKQVDYVLSNAYAFGGINSSILLGKV